MWTLATHREWVELRLAGRVTAADLARARTETRAAMTLERRDLAVIDFSEIERFELRTNDLRDLARWSTSESEAQPGCRMLVIAPRPELYGMARAWQQWADPVALAIVRSREEADAWLAGDREP